LSSSSESDRRPGAGPGRTLDERAIDRKLLALLISRHGAPPRAAPLDPEEEERRLRIEQRDRALAAADPDLLLHIERHRVASETFAGTQRAALRVYEKMQARRSIGPDEHVIRVRDAGEVRELEPSEELFAAMENKTPQAFLRDLHRPVQHFGGVELRRVPSPTAAASLARARALVSETMGRSTRGAASVRLSSQLAQEGLDELRAALARPWEESRPANPLPMPSRSPSVEDMRWFGMSGGYDPDV
jgi:hypothetical protein